MFRYDSVQPYLQTFSADSRGFGDVCVLGVIGGVMGGGFVAGWGGNVVRSVSTEVFYTFFLLDGLYLRDTVRICVCVFTCVCVCVCVYACMYVYKYVHTSYNNLMSMRLHTIFDHSFSSKYLCTHNTNA